MHREARHSAPWILWPFLAVWNLVALIVKLTGRLVAVVLGVVFIAVGVFLCLTIVGAIIGIPLLILGFSLIARGLF